MRERSSERFATSDVFTRLFKHELTTGNPEGRDHKTLLWKLLHEVKYHQVSLEISMGA